MRRRLMPEGWQWTRDLVILAGAVFALNAAIGLSNAVRTNFFVDALGMTGEQILWLEGLREIPGLALVFIAAAMMALPPRVRATAAMFTMATGYALYLTVPNFAVLVPVEILASLGLHVWMPLLTILGTALVSRAMAGRVLGSLGGVASLAVIAGMGGAAVLSRLGGGVPLRSYYAIGAVLLALAGALLTLLPRSLGETVERPARILVRRRYWLYYLLTFMQGEQKYVLYSFGTLVLVSYYGWEVWQISTLLLVSAVVNMVASPTIGWALDRYGERHRFVLRILHDDSPGVGSGIGVHHYSRAGPVRDRAELVAEPPGASRRAGANASHRVEPQPHQLRGYASGRRLAAASHPIRGHLFADRRGYLDQRAIHAADAPSPTTGSSRGPRGDAGSGGIGSAD